MGKPAEKWNKAERLAVAGTVAPVMRQASEKTRLRRVGRLDKDGNVVGYTTLAEVQEALLRKQKIELEVTEGTRPSKVLCERCGRIYEPQSIGNVSPLCDRCRKAWCSDCEKPLSRAAALRGHSRCVSCAGIARRKELPKCVDCGATLSKRARAPKPSPGRKPIKRCKECGAKFRRKPLPKCAACGKDLSPSARVQPITHCRQCSYKTPARKAAAAKALAARWDKNKGRRSGPPSSVAHEGEKT